MGDSQGIRSCNGDRKPRLVKHRYLLQTSGKRHDEIGRTVQARRPDGKHKTHARVKGWTQDTEGSGILKRWRGRAAVPPASRPCPG